MLLDKVEDSVALGVFDLRDLNEALIKWRDCAPSSLIHHGALCCASAREWIFSTDYSQLNGESLLAGPRWLRQRFDWGPSRWPMSWCEAVKTKVLDCGAHAALAREVFLLRGLAAFPVQLAQQYTEDTTAHWTYRWSEANVSSEWIHRNLIYHEACAVEVSPGRIKIWDSSAGTWITAHGQRGFGSVLALRLTANADAARKGFLWEAIHVACNQWQRLQHPGNTNPLAHNPLSQKDDLQSAHNSGPVADVTLEGVF